MIPHTSTQVHKYTSTLVHKYTSTQVHKYTKLNLLILLIFSSILVPKISAQNEVIKEVPLQLTISNTAINRVVAQQWNNNPIKQYSGNKLGLIYDIQLLRPTVSVLTDKIEIQLGLSISSSENGNPVFNDIFTCNPEIVINPQTIHLDNIVTTYVDLANAISQASNLIGISNTKLIQVIEEILEPITYIMFKGNAIQQGDSKWVETSNIRWTNLPDVSYQLVDGSIILTTTPSITAIKPDYSFFFQRNNGTISITVKSKNDISIKAIKLWYSSGTQLSKQLVTPTNTFDSQTGLYSSKFSKYYSGLTPQISGLTYQVVVERQGYESLYNIYVGTVNQSYSFLTSLEQSTILYAD